MSARGGNSETSSALLLLLFLLLRSPAVRDGYKVCGWRVKFRSYRNSPSDTDYTSQLVVGGGVKKSHVAFVYLLFTVHRAALQQWQHLMSSLNVIAVIQHKIRVCEHGGDDILPYNFWLTKRSLTDI